MKKDTRLFRGTFLTLMLASASLLVAGCHCNQQQCAAKPATASAANTSPAPSAPVAVMAPVATSTAQPKAATAAIRIKAGVTTAVTDSAGNVWLPDQGFDGGEVVERPDLEIANTKDPVIYRAEHYSMDSFSWKLPNGKYVVKLHFCETYDGISGPGERVFSFSVNGQEFKDFDVFKKTGGLQRADVEVVTVDVTDGRLFIKFTSQIENPQINGIEIIPAT
jgi:hypothetical protein